MDIGSGNNYPSCSLSNFSPHPFVIDDVECTSMEGFLQSLKYKNEHIQIEVCKMFGHGAKKRGAKKNKTWKREQKLWWKGVSYPRNSKEYQELLDRAFVELSKNSKFKEALLATGNSSLTHSMGRNKIQETVLTENEFCSRLYMLRDMLKEDKNV